MLEYNLFENFNPNVLNQNSYVIAGGNFVKPPTPLPIARGVVMGYELWATGYEYTSTATLSGEAEVGNIIQVLTNDTYSMAISSSSNITFDINYLYLITDIDDSNKATLKNYFWACIDGLEIPTSLLTSKTTAAIFNSILTSSSISLMVHGNYMNTNEVSQAISWNRKSETDSAEDVAKDLFRIAKIQPLTFFQDRKFTNQSGDIITLKKRNICWLNWHKMD
ncbi:hypothetical protein [Lactococcus fujiensis]|uniref:hypothetical protein n=1 Tax=Lactococcus fujiensis TaxID=610251 RepID=UPI0006CF5139|nr:hypothetical protein [Lactococcus fujiensis]